MNAYRPTWPVPTPVAPTAQPDVTWDDLAAHAQARLGPAAWAYLEGGAADEITQRANRQAWADLRLRSRVLRDLVGGHTRATILGREWPTPLLVAPMAAQAIFHPDGETAVALAAAAQQVGMVISGQSSVPIGELMRMARHEPGRGPLWQQIVLHPDGGLTRDLAQEAEAWGVEALVVTVDAPVQGVRDRQRRSGFALPRGSVADPRQVPTAPQPPSAGLCSGWADQAPGWDDLEALRAHTRLPILIKGITDAEDALRARAAGCEGLIVSNHGGRMLDTLPPTAEQLPPIVEAVGGTMAVLVDGGIRRGTDVLKALALGAQGVLIGRPVLHGLAAAGAPGVAQVLRLLRDEFEIALTLTGCRCPAQAAQALAVPARAASAGTAGRLT